MTAAGPAPEAVVSVRDVRLSFGAVRALDGVSLDVRPGIVYGLLGPNGAGKTTLIRVLATLLRPSSGSVRVAGVDVLAHPTAARARIGLAGQFAAVDEYLTGRENVEMVGRLYGLSRRESRARSTEVLERIGLDDAADRPVRTYSGGMRRRLDLAASLVGRPQVMFLDEPTTGIDPRSRMDVWELVEDLVDAGTTVLLTTQYLEEADRLAKRIGVIHHGRVITEGTADELKDTLGGDVLRLAADDEHRAEVITILRRLTNEEPAVERATPYIRVPARAGAQTLMAAVRAFDSAAIPVHDIALQRPTLDDVFLALTGGAAVTVEDPTAEAQPAAADRSRS